MRKIALIFAAFAAILMFGIIGCGDNDNTPTNPTTAKLPTWDKANPCVWPYDIFELIVDEEEGPNGLWYYAAKIFMRHASGFSYGINTPLWFDPAESLSIRTDLITPVQEGPAYAYLRGLGYEPTLFFNGTIGASAPGVFEMSHIIWQQAGFGRWICDTSTGMNSIVKVNVVTNHKLADRYASIKWACAENPAGPPAVPRKFENRNCANGSLPFKLMVNGQAYDYTACLDSFPPSPGYWCEYDEYPIGVNCPTPPYFEMGWEE